MKKLAVGLCFLWSTSVLADSCTFNVHFNAQWQNCTIFNWSQLLADMTTSQTQEVAGSTLLIEGQFTSPTTGCGNPSIIRTNVVTVVVPNCTNKTRIGLLGHTADPNLTYPITPVSAQDSTTSSDKRQFSGRQTRLNSQPSLGSGAGDANFLEGMTLCVGDIQAFYTASGLPFDPTNIVVTAGNPANLYSTDPNFPHANYPLVFYFGPNNSGQFTANQIPVDKSRAPYPSQSYLTCLHPT